MDSRLHCKDRHLFAREYVYLTGHCLWDCASGDFASALALGACALAVSAVLNLHMARERRRQRRNWVTTRYNGGVIRAAQVTRSKVSEKKNRKLPFGESCFANKPILFMQHEPVMKAWAVLASHRTK